MCSGEENFNLGYAEITELKMEMKKQWDNIVGRRPSIYKELVY